MIDDRLELHEYADNVRTREDLVVFMRMLVKDLDINSDEWENSNLLCYLQALESYIEDMDGAFRNAGVEFPEQPSWDMLAGILYMGKIYE